MHAVLTVNLYLGLLLNKGEAQKKNEKLGQSGPYRVDERTILNFNFTEFAVHVLMCTRAYLMHTDS
jgi:hypothetical protein